MSRPWCAIQELSHPEKKEPLPAVGAPHQQQKPAAASAIDKSLCGLQTPVRPSTCPPVHQESSPKETLGHKFEELAKQKKGQEPLTYEEKERVLHQAYEQAKQELEEDKRRVQDQLEKINQASEKVNNELCDLKTQKRQKDQEYKTLNNHMRQQERSKAMKNRKKF